MLRKRELYVAMTDILKNEMRVEFVINLRPDILQALENDQELVSLLGGKRIYYRKAKKA